MIAEKIWSILGEKLRRLINFLLHRCGLHLTTKARIDHLTRNLRTTLYNNQVLEPARQDRLLFLSFLHKQEQQFQTGPVCPCCLKQRSLRLGPRSVWAGKIKVPEQFDRDIIYCLECGLFFIDPVYSEQDYHALYGSGYQSSQKFQLDQDPAEFMHNMSRFLNDRKASLFNISPTIGLGSGKSVLEIGSYTGVMLLLFHEFGYQVTGIELSKEARQFSQKLFQNRGKEIEVYSKSFEHLELTRTFDLIYAAHVIEHVLNPVSFLKKCAGLLNVDGLIIIETPIFEQIEDHYSTRFHDIHHTFFFTLRSLAELADNCHLQISHFHQFNYELYAHSYTNSVVLALRNTQSLERNLPRLLDFYEDSIRRQMQLSLAQLNTL